MTVFETSVTTKSIQAPALLVYEDGTALVQSTKILFRSTLQMSSRATCRGDIIVDAAGKVLRLCYSELSDRVAVNKIRPNTGGTSFRGTDVGGAAGWLNGAGSTASPLLAYSVEIPTRAFIRGARRDSELRLREKPRFSSQKRTQFIDSVARAWPNTVMSQQKKHAAPRLARESSSKTVVYLPRQIEAAATSLSVAIVSACKNFDKAVQKEDKDYLRALHLRAKQDQKGPAAQKAKVLFERYSNRYRNGSEIDPQKIKPALYLVTESDEWSSLFFTTRALWSMPYNKGYGRRLRFVVFDEHHEGVMGIVGLQSPPADLSARDRLFEYPEDRKLELVNCTMDAYSVGAVPPYSYLLGGKLCAGLIATDTVRQAYWRQYAGQKTQMLGAGIRQPLAAVTTTSAFGRSSQYNRLKFHDRTLAEPIGYTMGYGTMHLEHLYEQICSYLKMIGRFTEGGFGNGPKVRWQNICRALTYLRLPGELHQHGVKREVFLYHLVDGLQAGMAGGKFGAPISLPETDFSEYWRERWALPRAARFPAWNQGEDVALLSQTLKQAAANTPA